MTGTQRGVVHWRYEYLAHLMQAGDQEAFAKYGWLPLSPQGAIAVAASESGQSSGKVEEAPVLPPARLAVYVTKDFPLALGTFDWAGQRLGGWSLSPVHVYDTLAGRLLRGDGTRLTEASEVPVVTAPVGPGAAGTSVLALPDGSVVYDAQAKLLRRAPSGTVTTIAQSSGNGFQQAQLGPDGSVYFIDSGYRIKRIHPDGTITTVAGTGTPGDNFTLSYTGPAANANLPFVTSFAVSPDGSVYIGFGLHIERVGPEGDIADVIAGTSLSGWNSGNGGPGNAAAVDSVVGMAFAADGTLYFLDANHGTLRDVVRSITPNGIVHLVAGGAGPSQNSQSGNGIDALSAAFLEGNDLTIAPDGTLLVVDNLVTGWNATSTSQAIREITPDHEVWTFAGRFDASCTPGTFCDNGGPATNVRFNNAQRISIGANGHTYIADSPNFIFDVHNPLPSIGSTDLSVPDGGGSILHQFDSTGRHLRTVDAVTGTVLAQMGYDANGLLTSVTDRDGLVTTIERNSNGDPTAIVAPFGQTTTLTLDSNGYFSRVTDPTGNHWDLTYQGGQITSITNRDGHTATMSYDADGRLLKDADAAGGYQLLTHTERTDGFSATRTSAMGRENQYDETYPLTGVEERSTITPDGLTTSWTRDESNTSVLTQPNGMVSTFSQAPDPRFGIQSSDLGTTVDATPSGLKRTTTRSRTVALSNPNDLLSVVSTTDKTTVNGETWSSTYTTATNILSTTSPAGRTSEAEFDSLGHLLQVNVPELLPVTFQYDAFGRLTSTTQGTRVSSVTYGADGFVATSTDALNETSSFIRDLNGRVLSATRPDQAVTGFSYNGEGNTTEVVPPGDPAHDFTFDNREMVSVYTPPAVASGPTPTAYQYNLDKQRTEVDQPGPRIITYGYDTAGRLTTTSFPTGTITRTYDALGRVGSLAGPTGVTLSFGYDGALEKSVTWSGAVTGSLTRTFDTNFRLASESVNGGTAVSFGYDADSLLTSAGALSIARDANNGRVTGTTAGNVTDTYTYNQFGEVAGYAASYSGSGLLSFMYNRDDLGRITDKLETDGNGSHAFHYDYDVAGRLTQVTDNGTVVEAYQYDENGNRTLSMNSGGTFEATFDAQDRMLTYGTLAFTYTENGELATKTDTATGEETTYTYDALGNLREVVLPDGTDITYLVDALGRRVGKKVNDVLVKQWLWRGRLQPVAELDGVGNATARFVYAANRNVPSLVVTTGATYRLSSKMVEEASSKSWTTRQGQSLKRSPTTRGEGFWSIRTPGSKRLDSLEGYTNRRPVSRGSGRGTTTPGSAGGRPRIRWDSMAASTRTSTSKTIRRIARTRAVETRSVISAVRALL